MIKNEEEIVRIRGADQKGLEDMIAKHAPLAGSVSWDSGPVDVIAAGDESLLEYLDMPRVNCLNEAQDYTLKSIVEKKTRNTTEAYLESDADEQLLITLFFNQIVKVRSLVLHTKDPKFGPKVIKTVINNPALGFGDVENATEPTVVQVLDVPESLVKEGKHIPLRFVRYQGVSSLQNLVESNHGDEDVTRIDAIDVYGRPIAPVAATQLSGLRNFEGTHQQGVDLLTLFMGEGGHRNLSNAVSLLREAVLLCPPDYGQREVLVANLAVALAAQYEHGGEPSDLSEAIVLSNEVLKLRPPGHPSRALALDNLSNVLLTRYEREGDPDDLAYAIELERQALNLIPTGHPDRATPLSNLASALLIRYYCEGNLDDLVEAIERNREALGLRPYGHPNRTTSLRNLSGALLTRYGRDGSILGLENGIELSREAINLLPSDHPSRAICLGTLASALAIRYERGGSLDDLAEAIEQHRESLSLRPPGHPDRAGSLNNLSGALSVRHKREGDPGDMADVIELQLEALNLCPPGHPNHIVYLQNLSGSLSDCPVSVLGHPDLMKALRRFVEAVEVYHRGHPEFDTSFGNLSNALSTFHERAENFPGLADVIGQCQAVLNLLPSSHPDRAGSLGNLSNALFGRYEREGNPDDLDKVIELNQEALSLRPPGHPLRHESLSKSSIAFLRRYERIGGLEDLAEAIELLRHTLNCLPLEHPDRSKHLLDLSRVLLHAINRQDGAPIMHDHQALVKEVFEMLRKAVDLPNCPPRQHLRAALEWIDASRILAPESRLDGYSAALDQLDIVLTTSSTLEHKHNKIAPNGEFDRCRELGAEAASCAVRQKNMSLAVELLKRGRNLLFAQVGRCRVDLQELRKVNEELANRFSALSILLDTSIVSNQPALELRLPIEDPIERYRRLYVAWSQAVDDIRAAGFEYFLKPPNYTTLRSAAEEGPIIVVIPNDGGPDALIISKEQDTPFHVNLPGADEVALRELRTSLIKAVNDDEERSTEKSVKKVLGLLWDLVVGPIANALEEELHIPRHSRIWWCPTSSLSFLPLHAAGRYIRKDMDQNLPDRYVSSYTPTLQALSRARRNLNRSVGSGEKMLIVVQPDTPNQEKLRNAPAEAKLVRDLVKAEMETTLLSSEEGTRAAVIKVAADHSWLHLICHGIQKSVNPFNSCFCLYDEELTLHDLMQGDLPDAKFAFLAACHTATGVFELLDEGLHLAAGLQFAGFKSVVGTIWKVADDDGPVIAEAFYKALQLEQWDYSRAAYALKTAVKQLRERGVPLHRCMRFVHIGI